MTVEEVESELPLPQEEKVEQPQQRSFLTRTNRLMLLFVIAVQLGMLGFDVTVSSRFTRNTAPDSAAQELLLHDVHDG